MGNSKTLWSDYATIFYIVDGVSGVLIIILLLFTFAFRPKRPAVALAPPKAEPENTLTDLNNDGKIDVQDILLALQEAQKKQKKTRNNVVPDTNIIY